MSRRKLFEATAGAAAFVGGSALLPAWARSASQGNLGLPQLSGTNFDLMVSKFPVRINGRAAEAVGVNGSLPAPLIRFREGDEVTLNLTNRLEEDTSIHWHGLLVPFHMDGVPGVSFPGVKPGETFQYKFAVPQSGTYWYHSHSGLQEAIGHYGPLIIDPKEDDPVGYDREYVLVLSDWSFENPYRIFAKLKKMSETYNFQQRTLPDLFAEASQKGLGNALGDRAMWGAMRMSPRDISDVTGATYHYLINGHTTADNWNGVFEPGEKVRLRIINASAMSIFNVRMPGLPMTVVQSDGLNVQPLETDEFQIGVAETYDVIVQPKEARAYGFVAESIDRMGQAVATIGPEPGMRADPPAMRPIPTLTMKDMGMDHGGGHGAMSHGTMKEPMSDGGHENHQAMAHQGHGADKASTHDGHTMMTEPASADFARGPGVANIAMAPVSRLDEPGIGLEHVSHRTLKYSDLRSLDPIPDTRSPGREITIHLTSNMERYMWSFDGVKFSEVTEPIIFHEGERLRMHLVNNTMMPHPIHLHGMFFELNNGGGDYRPRKHTVIVKPGEKLSVDITADAVGDWAFHCHLLFHMFAGMMQVVSVMPRMAMNGSGAHGEHAPEPATKDMDHSKMNHHEGH